MGKWVKLGDVADFLTGFPFKSAEYTAERDGIRLVRGDNIIQGALRWDNVKKWPASDVMKYTDYMLKYGDVVLAMDRPWIDHGSRPDSNIAPFSMAIARRCSSNE